MELDLCQTFSPQTRYVLTSEFFQFQKRFSWAKTYANNLLNINPLHREEEDVCLCTYSLIPPPKIYSMFIMNNMESLLFGFIIQLKGQT